MQSQDVDCQRLHPVKHLGSVLINKFGNKLGPEPCSREASADARALETCRLQHPAVTEIHWGYGLGTIQKPWPVRTWTYLGRPGDLGTTAAPAPGKPTITRVPSLPLPQTGAWIRTHHPSSPAPPNRRFVQKSMACRKHSGLSTELRKVSCPPAVVPVHSRALESSP